MIRHPSSVLLEPFFPHSDINDHWFCCNIESILCIPAFDLVFFVSVTFNHVLSCLLSSLSEWNVCLITLRKFLHLGPRGLPIVGILPFLLMRDSLVIKDAAQQRVRTGRFTDMTIEKDQDEKKCCKMYMCLVHGSLTIDLGGVLQWQPTHIMQIVLVSRD